MNELDARAVQTLRRLESRPADDATWSAEDRQWASDSARREVGGSGHFEQFLAVRAHRALARLGSRNVPAAKHPLRSRWFSWTTPAVLITALLGGLFADSVGGTGHINLLSPPWLGLLGWNVFVYLLMVGRAAMWPAAEVSALRRLDSLRITRLLHLGAMALALGLIAGMYLRGLAFDYQAGWQSTFLDPAQVHALLSALLAPASAISGLGIPDLQAIAALRIPGTAEHASAALWIHLFALTIAIFVVLPRAALALLDSWRIGRRSRSIALDLEHPYFLRLAREQAGNRDPLPVTVLPYAAQLEASSLPALAAVIGHWMQAPVKVTLLPAVAFGDEDEVDRARLVGPANPILIVVFALVATPESEHHGALLARLAKSTAGTAAPRVLIDESSFLARFADEPERLQQRRAAWTNLLAEHGAETLFANLAAAQAAEEPA